MDSKGFSVHNKSINIKKRYNKNVENYLKIYRTCYKKNKTNHSKLSIEKLTKMTNGMRKYYFDHFKGLINQGVNVIFKICGAGKGKCMTLKKFITLDEEVKNIVNYFEDFNWYSNHESFINHDIENSINRFDTIWFDCYVECNNKLPGDGNTSKYGFCFYDCLAKCGIIQRYKNYVNQKGEKHEMSTYNDIIRIINSKNDQKLKLDGTVNTADIPLFEKHFNINIYVNNQKISNINYTKGDIYLLHSDNHFKVDFKEQRKGKDNIYDGTGNYNEKERILAIVKFMTDTKGKEYAYLYFDNEFKKIDLSENSKLKQKIIYGKPEIFNSKAYVVNYTKDNINVYKKEAEKLITEEEKKLKIEEKELIKSKISKREKNNKQKIIKEQIFIEEEKTIEARLKYVYESYKTEIENLKKYLNINLLKFDSVGSYINVDFKNHIKDMAKKINFDPVDDMNEFSWLRNGTCGAINYLTGNKDKIYDKIYQYDVKSAYPACMISKDFKIPTKRGVFSYKNPKYFIEDVKNRKLKYGIYHCIISKPENKAKTYFMFNDEAKFKRKNKALGMKPNYYSHFDIYLAYEQGLKIELVEEKNNCLVYAAKDMVDGETIFKNYYQDLFYYRKYFKERKQPTALLKSLISSLHGRISQTGKGEIKEYNKTNDGKQELILEEDEYFLENDYEEFNIEHNYARVIKSKDLVCNKLYRLHPFLLAYQKLNIYEKYIKDIESKGIEIVKVLTDGIYTTDKVVNYDNNYVNNFVGDLVPELEYYENVKIINKANMQKENVLIRDDLLNLKNEQKGNDEDNKTFYNFTQGKPWG